MFVAARSRLFRYSLPVVAVLLATFLRLALDPLLASKGPFAFFLLAVLVAARYGGLGPGLIATILGALIGDYFFVEPRFTLPIESSFGNPGLFAMSGVAISVICGELRAALAQSVQEEERLSLISDTVPQFLWTAGADGVCDFMNARWFEYSGAEPSDLNWMERVHPDDRPALSRDWAETLTSRTASYTECRIRRHDGVYRWFATRMVALADAAPGRAVKV